MYCPLSYIAYQKGKKFAISNGEVLMAEKVSLHAVIHGHVQGVFFRAYILKKAISLGLTGYARNLPSGVDVEVQAEGDKQKLEKLLEYLKVGPPAARVEKVTTVWSRNQGKYNHFTIQD